MNVSPTVTVSFIADTDKFNAGMKQATESVREFAEALKRLPWYMRAIFALQALLTRR
jgi:hypothetical protein